ncbi:hypothetical protein IV203_034072 [Nitzschia inconspicua]|uniref:Glycerophosphodiester phosphodiesterase n=1 Tax=Nitzschia inconspicua TaxID=303405 RepID=A0A9K3Q701_9STRA|nr:hypothetical protein IV203_034072 [Nitzschia inconspicua]
MLVKNYCNPATTSGPALSLPHPQVCSHQSLNAPTRHGDSPIDGSPPAMKTFWDIGVTCFYVDVLTLQDGTLLATHPRRLASMLSRKSPVVVEESLECAYGISLGSGIPTRQSLPDQVNLNLVLKQGPYLTEERLLHIVHSIANLQLESNVAICVTDCELQEHEKLSALDMLDILHRHNLQVITSNHKPQSIQLLVPSFRFESSWYHEIAATPVLWRLPMTVWTVDKTDDYRYALKRNVTAIIANRPTDYSGSEKDVPVENILE